MRALLETALADGTVATAIVVIVAAELVFLMATHRRRLAYAVAPGLGLAVALLAAQRHGGAGLIGLALLASLVPHAGMLAQGWRE